MNDVDFAGNICDIFENAACFVKNTFQRSDESIIKYIWLRLLCHNLGLCGDFIPSLVDACIVCLVVIRVCQ